MPIIDQSRILIEDIISEDPTKRIPYIESFSSQGFNLRSVKAGQRKLLLGEIFFLTNFAIPYMKQEQNPLIIYVGAAPGSHLPILFEMFPKADFDLWDPGFYTVTDKDGIWVGKRADNKEDMLFSFFIPNKYAYKYKVYSDFFSDEQIITKTYADIAKIRPVFFISDIRLRDVQSKTGLTFDPFFKKVNEVNNEIQIEEDNVNQLRWAQMCNPRFAMLKLHVPFPIRLAEADVIRIRELVDLEESLTNIDPNYKGDNPKLTTKDLKRILTHIELHLPTSTKSNGRNGEVIYTITRDFQYPDGFIYNQPWRAVRSTETRLIPYDLFKMKDYNNLRYEERLAFVNLERDPDKNLIEEAKVLMSNLLREKAKSVISIITKKEEYYPSSKPSPNSSEPDQLDPSLALIENPIFTAQPSNIVTMPIIRVPLFDKSFIGNGLIRAPYEGLMYSEVFPDMDTATELVTLWQYLSFMYPYTRKRFPNENVQNIPSVWTLRNVEAMFKWNSFFLNKPIAPMRVKNKDAESDKYTFLHVVNNGERDVNILANVYTKTNNYSIDQSYMNWRISFLRPNFDIFLFYPQLLQYIGKFNTKKLTEDPLKGIAYRIVPLITDHYKYHN